MIKLDSKLILAQTKRVRPSLYGRPEGSLSLRVQPYCSVSSVLGEFNCVMKDSYCTTRFEL